jgi:hypothetical protein
MPRMIALAERRIPLHNLPRNNHFPLRGVNNIVIAVATHLRHALGNIPHRVNAVAAAKSENRIVDLIHVRRQKRRQTA